MWYKRAPRDAQSKTKYVENKRLKLDQILVVKTTSDVKRIVNQDVKPTNNELDKKFTPEVIANEK